MALLFSTRAVLSVVKVVQLKDDVSLLLVATREYCGMKGVAKECPKEIPTFLIIFEEAEEGYRTWNSNRIFENFETVRGKKRY
jgi:hypothetical protein